MLLDLAVGSIAEPVAGRRWDPPEIARQVARRMARLERLGLQPGDRVFLPFGNRLEFFAELLAIWRLGGCAVPIDARLTAFEVETLAAAARPRLAIVDDATDATVIRSIEAIGLPAVQTTDTGMDELAAGRSGSMTTR